MKIYELWSIAEDNITNKNMLSEGSKWGKMAPLLYEEKH